MHSTENERMNRPYVVAHRGGAGLFPENSRKAFQNIEKTGVDGIECDIHVSADNRLVVNHDPFLITEDGKKIFIKDEDFKNMEDQILINGETPLLLEDVINMVECRVVVEIKDPGAASILIKMIEENPNFQSKVLVTSFFHKILIPFRQRYQKINTAALIMGFPADPVHLAKSCLADSIAFYYQGMNRAYVEECHRGGISVSVWNPVEYKNIKDMVEAGVDLIATDRPDIAFNVINEMKSMEKG